MVRDSSVIRPLIRNAGAIFEGESSAEVFGDYGIGPNHTLPTARAARFRGGLSVYDFLRVRTWVRSDQCDIDYKELVADTLHLAKLEGLYGHAMSADCRSDTKMIIKRSPLVGIIRADVDGLMEYHPVKHPIGIAQEVECTVDKISKLNANENAYGPPNGVGEAVAERMAMETSVYPDPDQIELRDRLVEYTGRRREEIVCGAGGDDIIQLLVQICRRSGVVISTPTFPMYDFFARINGSVNLSLITPLLLYAYQDQRLSCPSSRISHFPFGYSQNRLDGSFHRVLISLYRESQQSYRREYFSRDDFYVVLISEISSSYRHR